MKIKILSLAICLLSILNVFSDGFAPPATSGSQVVAAGGALVNTNNIFTKSNVFSGSVTANNLANHFNANSFNIFDGANYYGWYSDAGGEAVLQLTNANAGLFIDNTYGGESGIFGNGNASTAYVGDADGGFHVIANHVAVFDAVSSSVTINGSETVTGTLNAGNFSGNASLLTNGLFTVAIYVNSNRVVSASESNSMFTTNIVFYLDSTSSNLLFTFPSPPASANVSFSVINGGTNSVTLTNATGNTFKVANGYFSGFSNSIALGGYFNKSQTWINLNSTNWMTVSHSRTLQELQDVARNATGATNGSISTATTSTNDSAGRNISTLSRTNEPNSVTFTNAGNLISFNQSVLLTQANTNLVIDGTGYPNHMMFSVTCTNNLFVRLTNWATDSEITLKVFQGTGLTNAISYLTNASTTSPFTRAPFFYTLPTNTANSVLVNKWIFTTTTNSDLMGQVPIQ